VQPANRLGGAREEAHLGVVSLADPGPERLQESLELRLVPGELAELNHQRRADPAQEQVFRQRLAAVLRHEVTPRGQEERDAVQQRPVEIEEDRRDHPEPHPWGDRFTE